MRKTEETKMKKIITALALILLISLSLIGCINNVPDPEIENGRFNFSVTYEYDGEIQTLSGVYVCEYAGTDWALDGGYHRVWDGYIEGGTYDDHFEIGVTDDGGTVWLCLNLFPDYFMGEEIINDIPAPYLMIKYPEDELGGMAIIQEVDVIEELCGAKIISYQYDEPIKNSFN